MLRAVGSNILVKVIPVEQKKGGLLLPTSHDVPFQVSVINKGSKVEIDIKEDDVLLVVPYSGSKISTEDDGLLLISEKNILGVVQ
jgi:co-chaperonin GroES (HSP10)